MLMESGEGDFAQAPETIDLVASQNAYDLATLLTYVPVKIKLVERLYSTEWSVLKKWEKNSGSISTVGLGTGEFWPSYRFRGTNLVFNQIPNFSETGTIRIEGYKMPAEMSADADTPNSGFSEIYHNMLVLWATIACLEAKEALGMKGDLAYFRERLAKMEALFTETLNNRTESRESVDPFVVCGEDSF